MDRPRFTVAEPIGRNRRAERVAVGVPLPPGSATCWSGVTDDGLGVPTQCRVLSQWPDGTPKWVLVSARVAVPSRGSVSVALQPRSPEKASAVVAVSPERLSLRTDGTVFNFDPGESLLTTDDGLRLTVRGSGRSARAAVFGRPCLVETGEVVSRVTIEGRLRMPLPMMLRAAVSVWHETATIDVELALTNVFRARHGGGFWDLGDPGSIAVHELTVELTGFARRGPLAWFAQPDRAYEWQQHGDFHIEQRVAPRAMDDRVQPGVGVETARGGVAACVHRFWEKHPSALSVDGDRVRLGLVAAPIELQGGEQVSRSFTLAFAATVQEALDAAADAQARCHVHLDPQWCHRTGAVPFLPPPASFRALEQKLTTQSLEGPTNFFAKRDAVHEYGWRNFGDVWADHEQLHAADPPPVISHYNNQYDLLHSFLIHYLLSGDPRWWELAEPLAQHVMDIDRYHAHHDKAAYAGGMFWHTAHYHDAGTGTHRGSSATMRDKRVPVSGGGPSNEHNYSSGLLLYHHLTGSLSARAAVEGLGRWVIEMDRGDQHLLGVCNPAPTGFASATRDRNYHGPGRGSGNSIAVLLDAWSVSGEQAFLDKSVELIRRTVHPHDQLLSALLDTERRWSYTVHLHSLGRFLHTTADRPDMQNWRAYVADSLLTYARWMCENERPALEDPHLEYRTESWPAQDLRKGNVLLLAAAVTADPREQELLAKRGSAMVEQAWDSLFSHATWGLTRPMAVALQQAPLEGYLRTDRVELLRRTNAPWPEGTEHPLGFVSQRDRVGMKLTSPVGWIQLLAGAVRLRRWLPVTRRSFLAERVRRSISRWWPREIRARCERSESRSGSQ